MPWTYGSFYPKVVFHAESPTLGDVTAPFNQAAVDEAKSKLESLLAASGVTVDSWEWKITVTDDTGEQVWVLRGS